MKKSTLSLLFLLLTTFGWAQIITTTPTFITKNYTGEIQLVFDATQGTAGLKDYAGTDGVYAHIGVITSASSSNSDWKHATTWGANLDKHKLTSLGNNKWKLLITPSMTSYFGLTTGEVVNKIAIVFRSGLPKTGTTSYTEGKDTGGTDIFVSLYDAGLNVAFSSPTGNQSTTVGSSINFVVSASIASNLSITLNGSSLKTASAATTLSYTHNFTTTGDFAFIASATLNGVTLYDTLKVCVPEAVTSQARPAGTVAGINYIDNTSATLVLHAPNKSSVFLIGEFNDWSQLNAYQLKKDGEYWWITLTDLTPAKIYAFQYLVDGSIKISDPYTEMVLDPWNDKKINEYYTNYPNLKAYPDGKTDGIVATLQTAKPAYSWEATSFTMPSKENMVIYELLLRDFTKEKSLDAAIAKLDYLQNLGVTAIELMPIQEFDGNNSWGYNPSHYFAPDKAYGNADMYKKFIDECHKRGMAVLLDVVLNHATGNSPFAKLFWDASHSPYPAPSAGNPWMNVTAPHPYSVENDFNHSYTGTKDYFKRMLKYWINEYKVDGYRLDLTKGLTQNSSTEANASTYDQSRIDNITEYYNAAKEAKSDVMFILEHFCNNDEETALANKGMYLWRNVNNAFSQSAMGYQSSSDFGGMVASPRHWVGYAESHDEERNFFKAKMYGDATVKTDSVYRISRVPLNIAFATLMHGPKMMWEFQELGYDNSIDSFGGRTDPKPSAWGLLDLAHRKAAYDTSAKIITLRKMYPRAFTEGAFSIQSGSSDWAAGRRIELMHADLTMIVLGNFQSTASVQANPNFTKTGTWYNLLTGASSYVGSTTSTITLQPGELLIYTDKKISFPNAIDEVMQNESFIVFPSITKNSVFVKSELPVQKIEVYNLQSELVKSGSNVNEINLTSCAQGLYLVSVTTNAGTFVQKIIKE